LRQIRWSAHDEQFRERRQYVFMLQLAGDDQRQAFPARLVGSVQTGFGVQIADRMPCRHLLLWVR